MAKAFLRASSVQAYVEASRASRSSCDFESLGLAQFLEWPEFSGFVRELYQPWKANRELAYIHQRNNAGWVHLNLAQQLEGKSFSTTYLKSLSSL